MTSLELAQLPSEISVDNSLHLLRATYDETDVAAAYTVIDDNRDHLVKGWQTWAQDLSSESFAASCARLVRHPVSNWGQYRIIAEDSPYPANYAGTLTYYAAVNDVTNKQRHIGYYLASGLQGRGYATRATQALTDTLASKWDLRAVAFHIHPENSASQRVATRLGAVATDETRFVDGINHAVWRKELKA